MKVKQFVRISILVIAIFAILANLSFLQVLACNMAAPKLPLDESAPFCAGAWRRLYLE